MKDTDKKGTDNSASGTSSGEEARKHDTEGEKRRVVIPGGAGAAGQIPIKGDDSKLRDDPLRDDSAEHADK